MTYIPHTIQDQQSMLEAIGVSSIDELFAMIPDEIHLTKDLDLPAAMGELALSAHMERLGSKNLATDRAISFLGAGIYDHFIPALVDVISSRGEFYTAYTPYQAEASQGTLQVIFEYQTLITELTGMDVSNASMYDGGTAAVEAVFMATSSFRGKRKQIVVAENVHPEYRATLATYAANMDVEIITLPTPRGTVDLSELQAVLSDQTACVLVGHPSFFGTLEDPKAISEATHAVGAVMILATNPISLGVLKRPSEFDVDIVVAEGQALGNPMSYGGASLGIMACRDQFVRQMPGRLVGQTTDRRGQRCWVLTLQTREQHIRREKATSNICTNQGLYALRAAVYLATLGPQGLRETAELCTQKAHYAMDRLTASGKLEPAFDAPFFNEFVLRVKGGDVDTLLKNATEQGIFAGVPLGRWYPALADCILVAVTEKRSKEQIDRYASTISI